MLLITIGIILVEQARNAGANPSDSDWSKLEEQIKLVLLKAKGISLITLKTMQPEPIRIIIPYFCR